MSKNIYHSSTILVDWFFGHCCLDVGCLNELGYQLSHSSLFYFVTLVIQAAFHNKYNMYTRIVKLSIGIGAGHLRYCVDHGAC